MIKWYADEKMAVMFSETPDVDFRVPEPGMTKELIDEIAEKPFLNKKEIEVHLWNHQKSKHYKFKIPKGYTWDGASIPRLCWRVIGAKTDSRFVIPSLIHDVLCENHHYIEGDRYFSTMVLNNLLIVSNVHPFKRWLMKHPTDNFQKTQKWGAKK